MKKPFFSIIIATYNHAHLISACINSLINQTYDDWEAIIINNHSTDNTIEVVNGFYDSRIRIISVYNEGILAKSRNKGIREARGNWICMLDSDDVWYRDKLKKTYETIKQYPNVDVVAHDLNARNMVDGTVKLMKRRNPPQQLYKELLLVDNCFLQTGLSYNLDFINSKQLLFDENKQVVTAEDLDFTMQLINSGARIKKINETLGEWRIYRTNWSSSSMHLEHLEYVLRKHVYNIQTFEPNKDRLWNQVEAKLILRKSFTFVQSKDYIEFIKGIFRAFIKSPQSFCRYVLYKFSVW